MIKTISSHIHHTEPSSVVVFVLQQVWPWSQEYVDIGSWRSEHVSLHE